MITTLEHEAIAEAKSECACCRGRKFGDCFNQCRYFFLTAALQELPKIKVEIKNHKPNHKRKVRGWLGPKAIFTNRKE